MKNLLAILRIVAILCLLPCRIFAATGDISNVTILANGMEIEFTVEGFSSSTSYAFGYSGAYNTPGSVATLTITSQGHSGTTLTTTSRSVGVLPQMRFPYGTYYLSGTFDSGTFVDGEVVTQSTTNATGIVIGAQGAGSRLILRGIGGTGTAWNSSNQATGGTSGALFTPSAALTAYSVPTNHERATGSGLVIRCPLAQPVFVDDNTGAGKSGVAPTITIPAGLVVSGGNSSNALVAGAVTNNSTLVYAVSQGQWDHIAGVCTGDRVTGAYDVAVNADHKFGVAAVRIDATGETSGATATATLTESDIVSTRRSATGLYAEAFKKVGMSVAGFTSGEVIALRFRVYPKVGDAASVLDTDSYTVIGEECRGANKARIVYNSTVKYAFVDVVSGNNANTGSTTLATAIANPIQHIGKAIQNDCNVIYLKSGQTHPALGTISATRRTTNEWYKVQPEPGGSATVQLNTVINARCERLQYDGVTLTLAGTTSYLDGGNADNCLRITNCVFDSSGVAMPTVAGINYDWDVTYIENCTGDLGRSGWNLGEVGAAPVATQFDGCTFDEPSTSSGIVGPWYRTMACSATGGVAFTQKNTTNIAPTQENAFFWNNRMVANTNTTQNFMTFGSGANGFDMVRGVSIRGNLIERSSGTIRLILINADSSNFNSNHVIFCNNTLVGEGANVGYNDLGSYNYARTNWEVSGNISEGNMHTKHDTFVQAASSVTRVGTTATFNATLAHGLTTGDLVTISGANQAAYNGTFIVTVTNTTVFTYVMGSDPGATATGNVVLSGNSRRVNGFNILYGTGQTGNLIGHITGTGAAGSFGREFAGPYCYQPAVTAGTQPPAVATNATTFFQFVNRTLGAGDYRLHTGSPAYQLCRQNAGAHRSQRYDMRGKPFAATRENSGCYAESGVRPASMFIGN